MAIVGASITNVKAIENALIKAFEKWAEEDINDAHWDEPVQKRQEEVRWPNETSTQKQAQTVGQSREIFTTLASFTGAARRALKCTARTVAGAESETGIGTQKIAADVNMLGMSTKDLGPIKLLGHSLMTLPLHRLSSETTRQGSYTASANCA
jgi:hypothetical protein